MKKNQRKILRSFLFVCLGLTIATITFASVLYDVPDKPGKPEYTDWSTDWCSIKYTAPKSDGGSPVTAYIIEGRYIGRTNWERKGETQYLSYRIMDIQQGTSVEFRVCAENRAGRSEPSEPSNIMRF